MSDDLIAFLRARIDWDEQDLAQLRQWAEVGVDHAQGRMWVMGGASAVMHARRALAEVEAKRQLLDCLVGATGKGTSRLVANDEPWAIGGDYLVKLLALPYVDHPDYRPEWRPV